MQLAFCISVIKISEHCDTSECNVAIETFDKSLKVVDKRLNAINHSVMCTLLTSNTLCIPHPLFYSRH